MEKVYAKSQEEAVAMLIEDIKADKFANTVVFVDNSITKKDLEGFSEKLSLLVGRKVVVDCEKPSEECPNNSVYIAYREENGGRKLTLEEAFMEYFK